MRTHRPRKAKISLLITLGLLAGSLSKVAPGAAIAQALPGEGGIYPFECEGSVPDAEPDTPEWFIRDTNNIFCAQQRHLDKALHPVTALPTTGPPYDAYRVPSRHDGTRFRFQSTTIAGLATEIYRPCSADTCPNLPEALARFDPPYPTIVSIHGGASRRELHWWSSQPLAEAGYLVVSFKSSGLLPTIGEVESMLGWVFDPDNPLASEIDTTLVGLAGHSTGGALASRVSQLDPRVRAGVEWDRGPNMPLPPTLDTPLLFLTGDWGCQVVPVCQPTPRTSPPNENAAVHGPWPSRATGPDFERMRDARIDSMKISLRATTHLDWVPSELSGNRHAELVTMYYTIAWFDRYLKGAVDEELAQDAYERLTADTFDDSADRHNISQGFWDPVQAVLSLDPLYGGNVPYAIGDTPVRDKLSFYYYSRCFLTPPGTEDRVNSDDMRSDGCS